MIRNFSYIYSVLVEVVKYIKFLSTWVNIVIDTLYIDLRSLVYASKRTVKNFKRLNRIRWKQRDRESEQNCLTFGFWYVRKSVAKQSVSIVYFSMIHFVSPHFAKYKHIHTLTFKQFVDVCFKAIRNEL